MSGIQDLFPKIWSRGGRELEDFFDSNWPFQRVFDVDVRETKNDIIVEADLPGFEKEEITVELEEYAVTIKADRSVEREEKGEKFYRRERQYGKVERTIPLPAEVTGKSKATYRNGVLTITLEKKHPTLTSRKTITIE